MDTMEKKIIDAIDAHREDIIAFGRDIWHHAELGYKEYRTSQKFAGQMQSLHLKTQTGLAVTGVKSYLKPYPSAGPTIALMGEMDALPIPGHPDRDPETNAAHGCGHHAQITSLVGAAYALSIPEISDALCGNVVFFAVPAEEYVDITYRERLIQNGVVTFGGGKTELLQLDALNDIDMIIGCHMFAKNSVGLLNPSMNGFVNKVVTFHGRSAHAASQPEMGINALNAASVMMHAMDAQRETFRDQDSVRIHGFISEGGTAMNIISDRVTMEYSIRAKTMDAIRDADRKFNRAVHAGAIALGCSAEISTIPGYWPLIPAADTSVMEYAIGQAAGNYPISHIPASCHETASSDYGELSQIYPLIQFYTGGLKGTMHNSSLTVDDEELAYLSSAKIYALAAYQYLKDHAAAANTLIKNHRPERSRAELLSVNSQLRQITVIDGALCLTPGPV